jgi:hypothetical protein
MNLALSQRHRFCLALSSRCTKMKADREALQSVLAVQHGLSADAKQRSPIESWYSPGGELRSPSVDGQRSLVRLKPKPLDGGS